MTINVLLVENNINYGRQLINILAMKNKDFRLCGITTEKEESQFILNNSYIDIVLIDMPLKECQAIIDLMDPKKSVIVLVEWKYVAIDYYNCNLEKDIYPIVAKKYGKSVNNIKTNIKNANEIMYFDNEECKIMNYFRTKKKSKPHTKQIIKAVLKRL